MSIQRQKLTKQGRNAHYTTKIVYTTSKVVNKNVCQGSNKLKKYSKMQLLKIHSSTYNVLNCPTYP